MSIEILDLDNIEQMKWNELVMSAMNGTAFNTIEWAKIWKLSFPNVRPLFIILEDEGIQAGIPLIEIRKFGFNSYYSMPYGDYGGILFKTQLSNYSTLQLFNSLTKLASWKYGRITLADFYGEDGDLGTLGFEKIKCTTHILPLHKDPQVIWQKLTPSKRQLVRQAQGKGVEISLVKTEQDVKECYKMLEATAIRHGRRIPRFPLNFYLNIFNEMGKFLRWSVANQGDAKLANMMHFVYRDSIIYWDGGSYTQGLQYRPNDTLIWDSIKWGCEHGYKYYNLGGSPSPGLVRFKERWGAEEKSYWTYYKNSVWFDTLIKLRKIFLTSKSPKVLS